MGQHMDAQWREAVKQGGLQAFTYFRGLLLSGREWTEDDRQGMLDLLNASEEHMVVMWETLDEIAEHERMTQQASEKLRTKKQ